MPLYKPSSKFAGPPAPRRQLCSKAARKSAPQVVYPVSSDDDSNKATDRGDTDHSDTDLAFVPIPPATAHRPNGTRHRVPRSRVAGPPAPRKQLATKAARKSAPSQVPQSNDSGSDEDDDAEAGSWGHYLCRKNAGSNGRLKRGREAETGSMLPFPLKASFILTSA